MIEVLFFANFHILVLAFPVERARARPDSVHSSKGQTKWKQFFQVDISSKKQTNEFYFTTMKPQVDLFSFVFWRKLKTPKKHFEID